MPPTMEPPATVDATLSGILTVNFEGTVVYSAYVLHCQTRAFFWLGPGRGYLFGHVGYSIALLEGGYGLTDGFDGPGSFTTKDEREFRGGVKSASHVPFQGQSLHPKRIQRREGTYRYN